MRFAVPEGTPTPSPPSTPGRRAPPPPSSSPSTGVASSSRKRSFQEFSEAAVPAVAAQPRDSSRLHQWRVKLANLARILRAGIRSPAWVERAYRRLKAVREGETRTNSASLRPEEDERPAKRVCYEIRYELAGLPCSWPILYKPQLRGQEWRDSQFVKTPGRRLHSHEFETRRRMTTSRAVNQTRRSAKYWARKVHAQHRIFELAGRRTDLSTLYEQSDESSIFFSPRRSKSGRPRSKQYHSTPRAKKEDATERENAMSSPPQLNATTRTPPQPQPAAASPLLQQKQNTEPVTARILSSNQEPATAHTSSAEPVPVTAPTTPILKSQKPTMDVDEKQKEPVRREMPIGRFHHYALKKEAEKAAKQKAKQALRDAQVNGLLNRAKKAMDQSPDAMKAAAERARRKAAMDAEKSKMAAQLKEQKLETEIIAARLKQSLRLSVRSKVEQATSGIQKPKSPERAARRSPTPTRRVSPGPRRVTRSQSRQTSRQPSEEPYNASTDQVIHPLQGEWADKVDQVGKTTGDPNDEVAKGTNNVPLLLKTFLRMLGDPEDGTDAWLDDEAVNAFLHALVDALNKAAGWTKASGKAAPFAALNTAWYSTYSQKGVQGIKTWAKRQGVGGKLLLQSKGIFFPINSGSHWTLLFINPVKKRIEYFDSLHGNGDSAVARARAWLAQELGDAYLEKEWKKGRGRSQRQNNMSDCGVFTCFNALAAAQEISTRAVTSDRMPNARRQMAAVLLNGGFKGAFALPRSA